MRHKSHLSISPDPTRPRELPDGCRVGRLWSRVQEYRDEGLLQTRIWTEHGLSSPSPRVSSSRGHLRRAPQETGSRPDRPDLHFQQTVRMKPVPRLRQGAIKIFSYQTCFYSFHIRETIDLAGALCLTVNASFANTRCWSEPVVLRTRAATDPSVLTNIRHSTPEGNL